MPRPRTRLPVLRSWLLGKASHFSRPQTPPCPPYTTPTVPGTSRSLPPPFMACVWCTRGIKHDICKDPKRSPISSIRHGRHLDHAPL
ncbi:hypothetical protein NDU88_006901 [Pleurodeles waltl]|uniref:Secreted protein n=1 Tax=Pleurodeles waltl TaxID=8319 RepID=A0AAV7UME4_PLEWA|nr:hypothetical protein NDU88_006901 [Pleurodeles waltl]